MKRFVLGSFLSLMVGVALGQNKVYPDPSFSTRNYKHVNQATYARRQKLEQSVRLGSVLEWSTAEHKHRYNQSGLVLKVVIKTKKANASRVGYKHPLGL